MFNFIEELGIEMDMDMAESIYTGIINDTGNFAHDNVSEETFKVAAKLKNIGVDTCKIVREFFQTKSMPTLKLMGLTLNGFEFIDEKKLSYFFLTQEALKSVGGNRDETEGLVELLRSYEGTEVALFLREEEDGKIKGSLRSKSADVNKVASIFGGGGHMKAAGFNTDLDYREIVKRVVEKL
jgi:phosphoesterase RecJ-like protein